MQQEYKVIDKRHDSVAIFIDDEQRAIDELMTGNEVFYRPTFTKDGGQEWRKFCTGKDLRSIDEKRLERLNNRYHAKTVDSYKNRQTKNLIKFKKYREIKDMIRFDENISTYKIVNETGVSSKVVSAIRRGVERYDDYLKKYNEEVRDFDEPYAMPEKPITEKVVRSARIRTDKNWKNQEEK